jgi:hypothetical protein
MVSISLQFFEKPDNWLRKFFLETITVLSKYKSPVLDPNPDLAVKIPDPAKRSGFDRIPDPDPQYCFMHSLDSS